jgi:SAM-dependent methyltransferase
LPLTDPHIIEHMAENFHACVRDESAYSDTWSSSITRKGSLYGRHELENMLALGNRTNLLIRNLAFFLDPSGFDPTNDIHRDLLLLGESPVGNPFADLEIQGLPCSSLFLYNLVTAAEIIDRIRRARIERPRILEIGGGYGTLCGLLRTYYGPKSTIIAVDLPETLALQEWYLRTRFPDATSTYKPDQRPIEFAEGGLNFINAHVLATQDVHFDVALNILSMGEMHRTVARAYVRYIERNIATGGFFYFLNSQAHCIGGTPDVSEYDFDEQWSLSDGKLTTPFENMAWTALMRFVLTRSATRFDRAVRRFTMRLMLSHAHTGFLGSRVSRDESLLNLANENDIDAATRRLASMIGPAHPSLAIAESLLHTMYVPQTLFDSRSCLRDFHEVDGGRGVTRRAFDAIKCFEGDLFRAMRDASARRHEPAQAQLKRSYRDRDAAVEDFIIRMSGEDLSEYWTAWAAGMLGSVGNGYAAASLIKACLSRSVSTVWLARFAYLLQRFGRSEAEPAIHQLALRPDLGWCDSLKLAEMQAVAHDVSDAESTLDAILSRSWPDYVRPVLIKTAFRIGRKDIARSLLPFDFLSRLDIAAFAVREHDPDFAVCALHDATDRMLRNQSMAARLACGAIFFGLGERRRGATLISEVLDLAATDYFLLGEVGSLLHEVGAHEWAEQVLRRALATGPKNVQQLRFVGMAQLLGGAWTAAADCFERASAIVPHLPGLAAQGAYCRLSAPVREAAVFGTPNSLAILYQDETTFYHDIGINYKRPSPVQADIRGGL